MCGIVGYIGMKQAAPVLLNGLSRLEYRGYDSAGLAVREGAGEISLAKATGRLQNLKEQTGEGKALRGDCGIGHTRWATHGAPTEQNAHPHSSQSGEVVLVHNGIIENYQELKEKLLRHGYHFYSDTDTEVAVNLIEYYLYKYGEGPLGALSRAMTRIRGSYAFAVMFRACPGELYAARKDSPMIIGAEEGECFLASDVPAILQYTKHVYYIGNLELARLRAGDAEFFSLDQEPLEKELTEIRLEAEAAEKGGFQHFMMKEIHEQPAAVRNTLRAGVGEDGASLRFAGMSEEELRSVRQLCIVACGSAYHVGMTLQYVLESLAGLPVRVELASEYRYRKPVLPEDTLVLVISQSGETADSLAALREAKRCGHRTLGIVNVEGSSIAREADRVFYTQAGPEIAVATTKAYSTQLIAGYLLALAFARARRGLGEERYGSLLSALLALPEKMEGILREKERLQRFAAKCANVRDLFFIGRGIDYTVGLEGSLKMKEISYIHSEAYAAGELKHGTISLIEPGTLLIGILTQPELFEKTVSNMLEVKSRGGYLLALAAEEGPDTENTADFSIALPQTDPLFSASLAVIPLQLLAYYVSLARGLDVDKPRNLAKSVTVE